MVWPGVSLTLVVWEGVPFGENEGSVYGLCFFVVLQIFFLYFFILLI